MLLPALRRLEAIVDAETEALAAHRPVDHRETNRAKSQSLLELTRLVRGLDADAIDAETGIVLARLRDKLALNQAVVAMHLRAVEELGETVAETLRIADSDGTYTARLGR